MRRLFIVFVMTLIAVPSLSSADVKQFTPRILDYYGELEVDARYQNDANKVAGLESKIKDTTVQEKLTLYTLGYVYHPNFITFRLKLSGGLREEKFTSTFSSSLSKISPIDEYEFRVYVLPEHIYNLELFTVRQTPLTRASLNGINPVSTSYGAVLQYDQKPYGASLSYGHQTTDAGDSSTVSQIYSARGIWFFGPTVNSVGYQHIDSTFNLQETTSRDASYFNNKFEWKNTRLESTVDLTSQKQSGSQTESFDVSSFAWQERLEQKLPWNFEASLYSLYLDDSTTSGDTPKTEVKSRETRLEISHQLFASLRSRYAISYTLSDYPQGETKTLSNSLNFSYTKKIPIGVVRAGFDYRLTQMERTGQPIIMNELHTASANGLDPFFLNSPGADAASIVIMVATVVPPGDVPTFVQLQPGVDYTVAPSGNTFFITVLSVPIGVCQTTDCLADPAFKYTFRVSYNVVAEDLKLNTTEYGFNIRFELFKSLLSPYFSYYKTTQNQISGSLIGTAANNTNTTVGLQVQKLPYIFVVEYENMESNINPARTVRSELDYRKDITSSVYLFGKLNYSNTNYPMGQSGTTAGGYTETIYGADLRVQKIFFSPKLNVAIDASYTENKGLSTSKTYAMSGGLSLLTGRTEIIFSGRTSLTDVQGVVGKQQLTSELFYLTFKRKFF